MFQSQTSHNKENFLTVKEQIQHSVLSNELLKKNNSYKIHPLLKGDKIWDEWYWDYENRSPCVSISTCKKSAYFFDNPYTISRGSAAVRGNKPLKQGVHYFEILVKEPLYGTAVMIGLGTEETCLHYENFDYVNLVGNDANSWGLCHKGTIHHNNKSIKYCDPIFDKDCIVGVLYNSNNKTLHYFLDGKYLGLAFKNVNADNKNVYPIISSTATDIELELIGSYKLLYSLEDMCCHYISSLCKDYDKLPIAKRLIKNIKDHSLFNKK